jgi:hypothetical protein
VFSLAISIKIKTYKHAHTLTLKKPCSRMTPKTIGTEVKIPIWKRNCVLKAALRAVFLVILALSSIVSPTPESA